jgi:hypothetical protein
MTGLALVWNHTKRTKPRTAKKIAWATGVVLIVWLIVRPM